MEAKGIKTECLLEMANRVLANTATTEEVKTVVDACLVRFEPDTDDPSGFVPVTTIRLSELAEEQMRAQGWVEVPVNPGKPYTSWEWRQKGVSLHRPDGFPERARVALFTPKEPVSIPPYGALGWAYPDRQAGVVGSLYEGVWYFALDGEVNQPGDFIVDEQDLFFLD